MVKIKTDYRSEIDGLRAIAVLAVIFYHFKFNINEFYLFSGGFFGVDIFFVISGYLITNLLYKELKIKGQIDLVHFYERRIRRIIPPILFVIIISYFFAWKILLPIDLKDFSYSVISALLFFSNFYFYFDGVDYQSTETIFKPLLHTWSLSVEEQFYILFPIFVIIIFKFFNRYLTSLILFAIFLNILLIQFSGNLSFKPPFIEEVSNLRIYNQSNLFNFYFLSSRTWELLTGSLIVFLEEKKTFKKNNLLFFNFGLILIFYSIIFLDSSIPSPSLINLIPVFGTFLIILYGKNIDKDNLIYFLNNKILVGIGLISYSLYLWHYPIISFINFTVEVENLLIMKIVGIFISFLFSTITYFLIEKKFRDTNINFKKILTFILVNIIFILTISFLTIKNNGYDFRFDKIKNYYQNFEIDSRKLASQSKTFLNLSKKNSFPNNGKKNVLFVGDSFAQDMFMLFNNIEGYKKKHNLALFTLDEIKISNTKFENILKDVDMIIFSSRINLKQKKELQFIENIFDESVSKIMKNKQIVIFSNVEFLSRGYITLIDLVILKNVFNLQNLNLNGYQKYYYDNKLVDINSVENLFLKNLANKYDYHFINREEFICDNISKSCDYLDENGSKLFYDYAHFTVEGFTYFSKKVQNLNWCQILNLK